jgi:PAS domain-containing protein
VLPVGIVLLDASGTPVLTNPAMRRYLPTGVIPSVDAARYGRWRGYHADGRRIERSDYPGARALRGETVVPGVEFLYQDDDGRETWVRVAAMPLKGANGCITGAVVVAADIDAAKRADETLRRSEERQVYLLGLSDALRPLADPAEIQAAAARILGEHLGVTRVVYGEVSADGAELLVARSYVVGSAPPLAGRYRMTDFGATLIAALREGRTVAVPDVSGAAELSAAERAAFTAFGIASLAGVPLVKHGRFVANLNVHHSAPRAWSPDDLTLIEATAERTWAAVERARAEGARRESEARLVAIANLVPDLLWSSDAGGKTDWYNQRWIEYSGQTPAEALGDGWLEAVHPDDRELSILRFQRISLVSCPGAARA